MPTDQNTIQPKENEGFLKGLGSSVRDHVDERLKSPFGGAFVLAWLVVNWKSLLTLVFSEGTIERRLEVFSTSVDIYSAAIHPVWLAVVIAILFYILSAFFIVISELYQWLSRSIRKPFDNVTWVHPTIYVELKRENASKLRYYIEAASDKLKMLEEEQAKTTQVAEELVRVQGELSEVTTVLNDKNIEISALQGTFDIARTVWAEKEREFSGKEKTLDFIESEIRLLADSAESLVGVVRETNLPTHPPAWNIMLSILNRLKNALLLFGDRGTSIDSAAPVSESAVAAYLDSLYPNLQVNPRLLPKVLADMRTTPETKNINTIAQLDVVMRAARPALEAFSVEEPALFKNSSDYLSKALGFVYEGYRKAHKFSAVTTKAFETYGGLVKR